MVFESIVTEVLNRVLGDYVENLDSKQLKLGIWGGDVVLKDLVLKRSALEQLNLPVQIVYGRLGQLVLKIPWKNLYGSPVEATVEGLYLLVVPHQQAVYDDEKEKEQERKNKIVELQKIDELKKKEAEKNKPKPDDTFVEKLTIQIIKNVQVKIQNIHLRYEDRITNSSSPFTVGITLANLSMETTDETWTPTIVQDTVSKIYKIVNLDGLAAYWNCGSAMYANLPTVDLIDKFKKEIASKTVTPQNYHYILGPIYSAARLRINPKPDSDTPQFSIPKIHLNLEMEKLYIGINKSQYRDIIALADSFTRMSKGLPYRKFRPQLEGYKNHNQWWLFAYNCTMNDIRRRRRDWSWDHMKKHREMCKKYNELYRTKLIQKKVSSVIQQKLDYFEQELDIFNIVVERQKVEVDLERAGKLKEKEAPKSFFSGWWGGSKANEDSSSTDIVKQFEEAMTADEKGRLYQAIGYQENCAPLEYPEAYVDTSGTFVLRKLEIQIQDDAASVPVVLRAELAGVKCRLDTRVAASALKVAVNVDGFSVFGVQQEDLCPELISSVVEPGESLALLDVLFETNPLDHICDHRIHVNVKPVKVIYDARTINNTINVFAGPPSSALEQLSAAAENRLNNIKEMSATGLQHAVEQSAVIDLKVDLHAPYVLIPFGGKYTGVENVLIINLGHMKMTSSDRKNTAQSIRELHAKGTDDEEILQKMMSQSYDQFNLDLSQLQILLVQGGEDWYKLMNETTITSSHLLSPLNINLSLYKCLITDDPRLPLLKVKCHLPSISLFISDVRLLLLVALAASIPLPSGEPEKLSPLLKSSHSHTSTESLIKYLDLEDKPKKKVPSETQVKDFKGELIQFTQVEARFVMNELNLVVNHQEMSASPTEEILNLKVSLLECDFVQQTFNMQVGIRLGGINCSQMRDVSKIDIINTPLRTNEYLIVVKYIMVNRLSPDFHSKYQSCETRLILDFSMLNITLHQEGLLGLLKFATDLQSQIKDITSSEEQAEERTAIRKLSSVAESLTFDLKTTKSGTMDVKKEKSMVVETIQFKLNAQLQELSVLFACDKFDISSMTIKGLNAEVIVKASYTQVIARLDLITIFDLNKKSIHSKVLTVTGDELAKVQIVMYNSQSVSPENIDMSVQVSLGCLRFIFLNWYLSNMLNFLNNFQTAQEAIIEASQTVADTAKHNVQNAYKNSTKISLNIDLKAPEIIVPVSSQSLEALMLDLGYITIVNKFTNLEIKNDSGQNAVVDDMKLKLTDLSIARIKLDNNCQIVHKVLMLQPVTFALSIKRNLSNSWYKSIADIDLSGKINSIVVLLGQSDYGMIMNILKGNLAEGDKPADSAEKHQISDPSELDQKSSEVKAITEDGFDSDVKVRTLIKFTLTMESFIINLFIKKSKKAVSPEHEPKDALARFSLEVLSVKGRILSDNSIACSVLLVNCLMDDLRKGREGKLTRLMERKIDLEQPSVSTSTESLESRKSMIDVTLQLKDNDTFVDVRVFSFTMILSVDYLLKVADFFTAEEEKKSSVTPVVASSKSVKNVRSTSNKPKKSDATMTLNLRVEKPDIILVEHMDSIDTNALILNTEIVMKVRLLGDHQVINGAISDIHLYTCCYDPAKRTETKNSVLHPMSLSVAGSTPEGQGLHVEVCLTNICISVSPTTIELLNRVYTTVTSRTTAECEDANVLEDYSNIWNDASYEEGDFWFLKAEEAVEALDVMEKETFSSGEATEKLKELCIISVPSLVITVEAGVGNKTLPMLLLDSSFHGSIHNWSSQLYIDSNLTLQMGYYNSTLAVWEPLIETVEVTKDNKVTYEPWVLKVEVSMNETGPSSISIIEEDDDEENVQIQPAAMTIDVSSSTNLELTVTKTTLGVLENLGKAFTSAISRGPLKATEVAAPYILKNKSGLKVTLHLKTGSFRMYGKEDDLSEVLLAVDAEIPLQLKPSLEKSLVRKDLLRNTNKMDNRFIYVEIADIMQGRLELPVERSDKRYFSLKHRGENNDNWGIVSAVTVDEGVQYITLRSIIQVHNHFHTNVDIYYMTARGNELECISSIEPEASFDLPLNAVYTPTSELFFSVAGYSVTSSPFIWKDLKANLSVTKILQCTPKDVGTNEAFVMKVVGETEQIYHENTNRHTMASTCYNIHLHPAIIFKNCLPVTIICCVQNIAEEKHIQPGELLHMPNVDPGSSRIVVRLPDYLEKEWSCQREVPSSPPLWSVWQFESFDSANKVTLDLGMHSLNIGGSMHMALYCPFWMLNKTGLLLSYRKSKKAEKSESSGSPSKTSNDNMNVLHHPTTFKGPILFSFNAKNFFGKKKACVRVEQGEWSDKFSLDVAGSSGFVGCKVNNVAHLIGVHNQLTYNGLTKQVTFTPYYVIINNSSFDIECQEFDRPADSWIKVSAKSCVPLWPVSERDDKLLKLRVTETTEVSAPFLYTETHSTLLKLHNSYGGINVDIQMTEGGIYINLSAYELGMAPALIINHTSNTMCIWEKETVQLRRLEPGNKILYTWENPSGPRVLVWDVGHKKELEDDLRKDGVGEFSPAENMRIFWVSFLDGMQRVLLFTTDEAVAENVQCAKQFEAIQQEINVLFHGLGFSLVNNLTRQEIVYIGISSSGIIWETCKMHSNRFKQMNTKDSFAIENQYQIYLDKRQLSDTNNSGRVLIDGRMDVDFESGFMFQPNKRRIRRTFQTGLWFQMKSSPNQLQLHAKINRLQIDNQMVDCIFPVVLAPVPPPKSVAGDVQKPFAELSIVQRIIKYSQIQQFKYFKVLIQEFHVKVDLGFVNAIVDLLQNKKYSVNEEREQFLKDANLVNEPLLSHVASKSLQEQKNFYDLLHFSPLKVHVSFSLQNSGGGIQGTPNFLNVLLQGLGVTLTDMQDVVFRLAYFEREYCFLTQRQLTSEATTHYVGQAVKQLYVLVLGLDVLGNPYGLVLGITKGVEDLFYEPFQGAIQGPGEFAEGLVLGVRSLFGHTVGGAAGAVSRITGALGKGIAALTFDEEYQHKRRDQINKPPASVQEGIARGGKGLIMGVVDGVTGVFTKPISGAKDQGVEGFFKGMGKGVVGLVTRPTAGVIDFASGTLDSVKRATEVGEDTIRLRPPRFIQSDGLIRHYIVSDAVGYKILIELDKGKYAHTDIYISHYFIVQKKEILMLTDKRLIYVTHNDMFGGWQTEWSYTWQEIKPPPTIVAKGVQISTMESKKKKLGIFGSSDNGKVIVVGSPALREEICNKIEEQLKNI
ncbi:hypothetical protein FQR65_LT00109 [Abscondita terminalis]|nr:hypothetical protein FQR65_LT00109 [Abscondita terminalis]